MNSLSDGCAELVTGYCLWPHQGKDTEQPVKSLRLVCSIVCSSLPHVTETLPTHSDLSGGQGVGACQIEACSFGLVQSTPVPLLR
jgi:hypothetical protein